MLSLNITFHRYIRFPFDYAIRQFTIKFLDFQGFDILLCRMLADPAFLYRLLLEQAATLGCSVWWELKNRKDRYLLLYYFEIQISAHLVLN